MLETGGSKKEVVGKMVDVVVLELRGGDEDTSPISG